MKHLIIIFLFFAASVSGQNNALTYIPSFPEQGEAETLSNFIQKLISAKQLLQEKKDAMEKENAEKAKTLDASKVVSAYTSVDPQAIMAQNEKQQALIAANTAMNEAAENFKKQKEQIEMELANDLDLLRKKRTDYFNKCVGEGVDEAQCQSVRSSYNVDAKALLDKYYIGKGAKFVVLANAWQSEMPKHYQNTIPVGLSISEFSMNFVFPHKSDLADFSIAYDYSILLLELFSVPSEFWPL